MDKIKTLIYQRTNLYNDYSKTNDTQIFEKLTLLQKKFHMAMKKSKDTLLKFA